MTKNSWWHQNFIIEYEETEMENEEPKKQTKYKNPRIRRLTPTECARLQTIPDWYEFKYHDPKTGEVKPTSDTQIYKVLGNGWTVEVIKHIFSFLPCLQKA